MYIPSQFSIVGSLVPAVDVTLHTFLGVSWVILLPYTIFGVALMAYSQTRLIRGQREINRQSKLDK